MADSAGCCGMIDITCPLCGEVYHADPAQVGKRIKCRRCRSLVPILGADGAIVERQPKAHVVGASPPRAAYKEPRSSWSRFSIRLGIAIVVVAFATSLLTLWRHSSTHAGIVPLPSANADKARSSSQTGTTTRGPSVIPDVLTVIGEEPRATGGNVLRCGELDLGKLRSLPNGSRITPDSPTDGHGVLEVQNGTSEDAVLSLYGSAADETIRDVYVQARHSVRMTGIPEGTYQLAYTAGLDWDEGDAVFRCDPEYAEFEREFVFSEERNREGIQYHSITVTLHPVVGGNIRTRKMSRQEFLKGHHRAAALTR